MRGRFDIGELLRPSGGNALAVLIEANENPGSAKQKTLETAGLNGGALGADNPVSENFYWRGPEKDNYRALRTLPKIKLNVSTPAQNQNVRWILTTEPHSRSEHPALMVRLKAVRSRSGCRVLPAFYSNNYVSLMAKANGAPSGRRLPTPMRAARSRALRLRVSTFLMDTAGGGPQISESGEPLK